ncbi:MAG: SpoIID/LytB domain-containing protein [Synechococcales bacterium]|nr:SpoIID/LytB domain-containing protein [Synechococcales bacterium]
MPSPEEQAEELSSSPIAGSSAGSSIQANLKNWLKRHPWILTPVLGIFPAIAWGLEQARPPQPTQPVEIFSSSVNRSPHPAHALPPGLRSPAPLPGVNPNLVSSANSTASPTASPTLVPVDLSKLTPEQKALNAKAKATFEASNAPVDAYVEMHIAIGRGAAIVVASSTPATIVDEKGKKLESLTAGEVYTAQIGSEGIALGNQPLPPAVFVQPDPGGLLYIGNRAYRGKVLLVIDRGQLLAVNYINLRHYLYSVVASEVSPSWKPEALKAQAVAARSYALTYYFRPANPLYHMGNDEYFQVYSGIEKEDDRTNQAVDITSGEYVSYKGGIVESLYAASDDIVAEAFAGKGMSQLGALSLAEQGYPYQQILGNYYPGTKVGRIVQDY